MGEPVAGLSVIRAYGYQERFLKHNEITMDENIKSVYPWIVSNRYPNSNSAVLNQRLKSGGRDEVFFRFGLGTAQKCHVVSPEKLRQGTRTRFGLIGVIECDSLGTARTKAHWHGTVAWHFLGGAQGAVNP